MRTPGLGAKRRSSTSGVCPIASRMSAYLPPHGPLSSRGSIIASKSVVVGYGGLTGPARHRGQDDQRIGVADRGLQSFQHPYVLVIQIDVHVAVQLAVLGEELALGLGMAGGKRPEYLADVAALRADLLLAARRRPKDRRDLHRAHRAVKLAAIPRKKPRSRGTSPSPRRRWSPDRASRSGSRDRAGP